jgi:Spy/CpxP family protein refolding chaperone
MNGETRKKAWEWLALLFVLGAAIGGVFGYNFAHRNYAGNNPNIQALSEPERRAQRVAEMTKEIGLTPEQSQKMDAVIAAAHEEMKTIHDKGEADVDGVRQKARAQMREFLTAEQKPKFEEFVRRMDAERKKQEPK